MKPKRKSKWPAGAAVVSVDDFKETLGLHGHYCKIVDLRQPHWPQNCVGVRVIKLDAFKFWTVWKSACTPLTPLSTALLKVRK